MTQYIITVIRILQYHSTVIVPPTILHIVFIKVEGFIKFIIVVTNFDMIVLLTSMIPCLVDSIVSFKDTRAVFPKLF